MLIKIRKISVIDRIIMLLCLAERKRGDVEYCVSAYKNFELGIIKN
jgi:hypothetical protein